MTIDHEYYEILMRSLLRSSGECLEALNTQAWEIAKDDIQAARLLADWSAHSLPAVDLLDQLKAANDTEVLFQDILAVAPYVHWRQTYTLEDGFDEHFLQNYAWFHLVSPLGPFYSNQLCLGFGYWGKGLFYRTHRHSPDEIYLLVAGQVQVTVGEGKSAVLHDLKPGDSVFVPGNTPHALDAAESAFLMLGLQWGDTDALLRKSDL